jgi:hypothetical protein
VRLDGECIRGPGKDRGMVFSKLTLSSRGSTSSTMCAWDSEFSANCDYSKTSGSNHGPTSDAPTHLLELMGLENFHHAFPR